MKRILLTIFSLVLSINLGFGQEFEEGYIKMEITDVATDNPEAAPYIEMMKGTETEYFFNKEKSLVKANMMGGMMEIQTIYDNSDESMVMFFNAMGNKMQIESSKEERDKSKAEKAGGEMDAESFKVELDDNVTKDILGHTCTKATVTNTDMEGFEMVLYVAKDIKASSKMIQGLDGVELEGFPLEYVMNAQGMNVTYTTTELSEELDPKSFEVNANGYQKMTWEEFESKMGAMGGAFGG